MAKGSNTLSLRITDQRLFGNLAGEDEDPEILASYFVSKPAFDEFLDDTVPLCVVRGRKGTGKSALLAKAAFDHRDQPDVMVLSLRGPDLIDHYRCDDHSALANISAWKRAICTRVNLHIGQSMSFAMSDTAMAMVEAAEIAGFKQRNLLRAMLDRIKIKSNKPTLELERVTSPHAVELLRRYQEGQPDLGLWLLVDDIDATFKDTAIERRRVSTFLSACRELVRDVKGLRIRTSVRTDVWSLIKRDDEAMDKVDQYMFDLRWSYSESRQLLVKKVHAYVQRSHPQSPEAGLDPTRDDEAILGLAFDPRVKWNKKRVPIDRPLHMLSNGRPRWSAQLCRLAAEQATRHHQQIIGVGMVRKAMEPFGRLRLDDLYREHSHQFEQLPLVVGTFRDGTALFETKELLGHLDGFTSDHKDPPLSMIDGVLTPNPIHLARFLYRIGFLNARSRDEEPAHYAFNEREDLLVDTRNLDDGLSWEIHPSYRQPLHIQHET